MHYRRMPIEIESPEAIGYGRIRYNLAESSVTDAVLGDLDLSLKDVVLEYGDHLGRPGLRQQLAADAVWLVQAAETPDEPAASHTSAGTHAAAGSAASPAGATPAARPNGSRGAGAPGTTADAAFDAAADAASATSAASD